MIKQLYGPGVGLNSLLTQYRGKELVLAIAEATDGLGFRATAAELRKQLELISKLQGELTQEGATTVNIALVEHADYQRLEELIFCALEHHHQARWDVAEALKELE